MKDKGSIVLSKEIQKKIIEFFWRTSIPRMLNK
mgnify:CR=1 FL=1